MFAEKITFLNQTVLDNLNENDTAKIVKSFTEAGIKILGADFGFVWLNSKESKEWNLVYKSPKMPYTPHLPKEDGRNYKVFETSTPDFVSTVKKRDDEYDVSQYMKSFVIIPISYRKNIYGNIVLCFKEHEAFSNENKILCTFIGNSAAQAITIHRLVAHEYESKATELLLKEEKMKTEFIANATHELRTPLAIIRGNVDLILREGGTKQRRYADNALYSIEEEVKHLSNMLADLSLLTSSKENAKNILISKEVDLLKVVKDTVKRLDVVASKKNITIKILKSPSVHIKGDRIYLEKMIANLVKNSITYGKEKGTTSIEIKKAMDKIVIEVKDNGIGISDDDIPHVFERFFRADKSHKSDGNSTGLGLSIVKWIADLHNGTVSVKSTLGKGSTFTIFLPL